MTDNEETVNRPANFISRETAKEQAKIVDERKAHAMSPMHKVKPSNAWQKHFNLWDNASKVERQNIVYGMVIHDGAISTRDITRFFGIEKKEFAPYQEIFDAGKAALKLKIQRNQISIALQREDNLQIKFTLGKQFAEQVSDPAHEGVAVVTNAPPSIVINEVKGANQELREELEATVQAAIAVSEAKTAARH